MGFYGTLKLIFYKVSVCWGRTRRGLSQWGRRGAVALMQVVPVVSGTGMTRRFSPRRNTSGVCVCDTEIAALTPCSSTLLTSHVPNWVAVMWTWCQFHTLDRWNAKVLTTRCARFPSQWVSPSSLKHPKMPWLLKHVECVCCCFYFGYQTCIDDKASNSCSHHCGLCLSYNMAKKK